MGAETSAVLRFLRQAWCFWVDFLVLCFEFVYLGVLRLSNEFCGWRGEAGVERVEAWVLPARVHAL